jgi:hypothetical protein
MKPRRAEGGKAGRGSPRSHVPLARDSGEMGETAHCFFFTTA